MTAALARLWRGGLRQQATVAAGAVVAVAMVVGSLALLLLLQSSLTSTLQTSLTALVDEDAQTLVAEGMQPMAAGEADRGADSVLVQVLATDGTVLYTSEPGRRTPPTSLRPAPGQTAVSGQRLLPVPGHLADRLVVAQGVVLGGAPVVVVAMASQEPQEEAVLTTGLLLLGGTPLLALLAAWVTWWRVGRALRSVDLITSQVEGIGAAHLTQRVPVPPTRDEIAHLAATMNEMLRRLEASDSRQRRFVADASHELRSPLSTLTASLEIAEADPTGRTWVELAGVLQSETHRMTRLVDDLLLLSKVDDGGLVLRHEDVDLDDVADRECRRLRQVSGVTVELDAVAVRVVGDELRLEQVVRNLVENAARAARSVVRVGVRRHTDGRAGYAAVTVEDDGPGIPEEDRERVFERFVRLDESRSRRSGGSGLGLAIVRQIVQAHGGTVRVGTSALGGALVEIALPTGDLVTGDLVTGDLVTGDVLTGHDTRPVGQVASKR